jgi:hypothetical protein
MVVTQRKAADFEIISAISGNLANIEKETTVSPDRPYQPLGSEKHGVELACVLNQARRA